MSGDSTDVGEGRPRPASPLPWEVDAREHDGETSYEIVSEGFVIGRLWGPSAFANAMLVKNVAARDEALKALVEKWQAQAKEFRSRGYRLPALHAERLDFCVDELAAVLRATEARE